MRTDHARTYAAYRYRGGVIFRHDRRICNPQGQYPTNEAEADEVSLLPFTAYPCSDE